MVKTLKYDLDTDTTLGGNNASDYIAPSQKAIKSYVDNHSGGGGTATDVQINGTSITSNNVANIVTNSAYNSSSNKIATMSDLSAKANDNAVVHNTGNETISGVKKFNEQIYVKNSTTQGYEPVLTYPNATNTYATKRLGNVPSDVTSIPPTTLYNFDGQWVQKSQSLNRSTSAGTWTYNLGSTGNNPINYLPDNNYYYEVLIFASGNSDSGAQMVVSSDVMTSLDEEGRPSIWSGANGRNHTQIYSLPVGPGGFIKQRNTAKFSLSASLSLYGYRRIGTNT